LAQQRHRLEKGMANARGMDAISLCLTDPNLQLQLTGLVHFVGAVSALCGMKDPWSAFDMIDKQPELLELTPSWVASRMLALRRALPGVQPVSGWSSLFSTFYCSESSNSCLMNGLSGHAHSDVTNYTTWGMGVWRAAPGSTASDTSNLSRQMSPLLTGRQFDFVAS
jgi:hypothetical protein